MLVVNSVGSEKIGGKWKILSYYENWVFHILLRINFFASRKTIQLNPLRITSLIRVSKESIIPEFVWLDEVHEENGLFQTDCIIGG